MKPTIKRVGILGGNGMLGSDLAAACQSAGLEVFTYDLPDFDIRDCDHVECALQTCDVIVNCAAYTNVDQAEADAELAEAVNARAVGILGQLAAAMGKYVLHVGTDFVFDGTQQRPYAETDAPCPLSTYGRTKLEGERLLARSACDHCIVRVQWTYGRNGHNFITKLLERAGRGGELVMVSDQIGSPTCTVDVARALLFLIRHRVTGLFHYAASGYATRYEVAQFILKEMGLRNVLRPCLTSAFPAAAARPLNSRFNCDKIDAVLDKPRPHWQESMREFLQQLPR